MDDIYNTGSAEDNYETRKRTRDDTDLVAYPKRANFGTKPGHYLLKVLVPPGVAGSIIGRGGAQIRELQLNYDVIIKLSQNAHFYPENKFICSERIVLITGPPDQLCEVSKFIHGIVRNPPQGNRDNYNADQDRRNQMMKIVVTNTTAGMIIGKGGSTIKNLNDTYDVRIQASQRDDIVLGERVISITGPEDGVNKTVEFIIKEKFRDDPTSTSITNLDYSSYVDTSGGYGNQGGNFGYDSNGQDMNQVNLLQSILQQQNNNNNQQQQPQVDQGSYNYNGPYNSAQQSGGNQNNNGYNNGPQDQGNQGGGNQGGAPNNNNNNNNGMNTEMIARMLTALPNNALANTNANALANAIMLVQALGGNSGGGGGGGAMDGGNSGGGGGQGGNSMGGGSGGNAMNQRNGSGIPSRQQLRPFIPRPDDVKYKLEIPDTLVGRILGRAGSTITEIQNASGCEVKFSQRGEYVPGTQNRLLYVAGQASGCKVAQQMVLQKIEGDQGDVSSADFSFEQMPN